MGARVRTSVGSGGFLVSLDAGVPAWESGGFLWDLGVQVQGVVLR
jgi:hypothetical protein